MSEVDIDPSKLVEARKSLGLRPKDVAKALGYDRRDLWRYETGKCRPMTKILRMVSFYISHGFTWEYFLQADSSNHN